MQFTEWGIDTEDMVSQLFVSTRNVIKKLTVAFLLLVVVSRFQNMDATDTSVENIVFPVSGTRKTDDGVDTETTASANGWRFASDVPQENNHFLTNPNIPIG